MTVQQSPSTYCKRIWVNHPASVSLYVQKESGETKGYIVTCNRRHVQTFSKKEPALNFAQSYSPTEPKTLLDYVTEAQNFSQTATYTKNLHFGLIAQLYMKSKPELNHQSIRRVGQIVSLAGGSAIPTAEVQFYKWITDVAENLTHRSIRALKTRRGVEKRFREFYVIFKSIEDNPIAFKRYLPLVAIAKTVLQKQKVKEQHGKAEINSFSPFSLNELDDIMNRCSSFAEVSCAVLGMSTGLRSGEFEKIRPQHIIMNQNLDLRNLVTKTKVKSNPPASVATRLAAQYSDGQLPSPCEKRRFRATCAVNLLLCNEAVLVASTRFGHTTTEMVIKHYGKQVPSDWSLSKKSEDYLKIGELKIGDWVCNENVWDRFCLRLLLRQAARFGKLDEVKERLLVLVGAVRQETLKFVDAF